MTVVELRGVGGWLVLFLVMIGIIDPLLYIFGGYQMLADPQLAVDYGDAWPRVRNAEFALIAILLGMSWFACWRFLNVFNGATVVIGIVTLWALAVLNTFGDAALVSSITDIPVDELMRAWWEWEMAYPFVEATIWSLYLLMSKRVKNTYRSSEAVSEVFE